MINNFSPVPGHYLIASVPAETRIPVQSSPSLIRRNRASDEWKHSVGQKGNIQSRVTKKPPTTAPVGPPVSSLGR